MVVNFINLRSGGVMYKYTVYEVLPAQPFFKKVDTVKAMTSESARRKAIIGTNTEYSKTCTMQEKKASTF